MNVSRQMFSNFRSILSIHGSQLRSGFKSAYSLDKVYPNSSLNIAAASLTAESKIQKNSTDKFSGYIPIDSLKVSYCKSSGPGGQNVNKVNTKVEIRFHLMSAEWISLKLREQIADKHKNTLTKDGYLIIKSDKTRSQMLNQADCMDKLRDLIRLVEQSVQPRKILDEEKITILQQRADRAAANRLHQKRLHSLKKEHRQSPSLPQD